MLNVAEWTTQEEEIQTGFEEEKKGEIVFTSKNNTVPFTGEKIDIAEDAYPFVIIKNNDDLSISPLLLPYLKNEDLIKIIDDFMGKKKDFTKYEVQNDTFSLTLIEKLTYMSYEEKNLIIEKTNQQLGDFLSLQ